MTSFSVITVTKNAAANLDRCIASLEIQNHSAVEYILIDGASTDGTLGIIEGHRHAIARLVSEPDHGIYHAMNKGLGLASGDFVYFLNADDYFVDERVLSDISAFLDANPNCDYCYGGIRVRFPDGHSEDFMPPPPAAAVEFLVTGCLPHQASFFRRTAFEATGRFDERYRIAGDYAWFLRVVTDARIISRRFDRVVASYGIEGVSSGLLQSQAEVFEIQNGFPLYQEPAWLRRRITIFQRESIAQSWQALSLSQPVDGVFWLQTLIRLLIDAFLVALSRGMLRLLKKRQLQRYVETLQRRVLAQRVVNNRLARGAAVRRIVTPK